MQTKKITTMTKIETLYEEYKPNTSIFVDEPDKVRKTKAIIFSKLTEPDRRIILLYTELQSIRKLSKLLNVSAASAWLRVNEIRNKIKEMMNYDTNNN